MDQIPKQRKEKNTKDSDWILEPATGVRWGIIECRWHSEEGKPTKRNYNEQW